MSTNPEKTHTSPETGARDAQVERFAPQERYNDGSGKYEPVEPWEHPDGDYVRFTDYEHLRAENERLRLALDDLCRSARALFNWKATETMTVPTELILTARAALKR